MKSAPPKILRPCQVTPLAPPCYASELTQQFSSNRSWNYKLAEAIIKATPYFIHFRFFEQYDDLELGALEGEEIQGAVDEVSEQKLLNYATEFKPLRQEIPYDKSIDLQRIVRLQEEGDSDELVEIEVSDDEEKKWDCQTILSTYSNLYNHPKLIVETSSKKNKRIQINSSTGIPMGVISDEKQKLSNKALAKLQRQAAGEDEVNSHGVPESVISTLTALSFRPKDETPEEKRERKKLVKEHRTDRRMERKANTIAFKQEKVKQDKIRATNSLKTNKIV